MASLKMRRMSKMSESNFGVIACKSSDKIFVLASGNDTTLNSIMSVLEKAVDSTVVVKKINIAQEDYNVIRNSAEKVHKEIEKYFSASNKAVKKPRPKSTEEQKEK